MGTLHRLMFKAAYAEDRPPLAPRPALARGPVKRPAASDILVGGGTLYRLLRSRAAMMEEAGAPDPPEASTLDASPSGEASTSDVVPAEAPKKKRPAEALKTYKKIEMPTPEQIALDDFMNNCAVKTVLATVMGGFLGATMGIFFGAFEPNLPGDEKLSVAQTLRNAARTSLQKAGSYAKGFAAFGALYSGSECVIEQTRAKHDIYNSAYAGCFTGGVMARSSGAQGMAMGCATMGALSVCMDKFMDLH